MNTNPPSAVSAEQKDRWLKGIGERLGVLDEHLVRLVKRRIDLSTLVVDTKGTDPIVVLGREQSRLQHIGQVAAEVGIDPYLAQALLHTVINAGVKHQTMLRDEATSSQEGNNAGDRSPEALRRNLLRLTESVAETYDTHQDGCPATRFTYQIENRIISETIESLDHRGTFVDLGTATGRMIFHHKAGFRSLVGYDISPAMVAVAQGKVNSNQRHRIQFVQRDLEQGIPLEDGTVSFVVMNNGTCGDIVDIQSLLSEVRRVLTRGGYAYLSFYNADALVHRSILPWQNSIAAIFNPIMNTLEVDLAGVRGTIPVHARMYSVQEIRDMVERRFALQRLNTFPFVTSLMPRELFREGFIEPLLNLDMQLCESGDEHGAYVGLVVQKI
ncbi:MAG: ubiE/COQ5 methyltransferase family [Candidatus Parcubacteria bacterium]|jgi:ubiquinone/menaquinone biosynthesis C-methylase UbiE/chorismate mutase